MSRKPCAAEFYQGASEANIEAFLEGFDPPHLGALPAAGLVPHAGWGYSGAVAAKVFQTIKSHGEPNTFVIFGTVHRGIRTNAVYARGSWLTPFGDVMVDEDFADRLLEEVGELAERDEAAHQSEHSIEVQMPFLKHFFPSARAVPISVLPGESAAKLGQRVGALLKEENSDKVVIGTTDLTHYGDMYSFAPQGYGPEALEWMKRNDERIINLATEMRAEEIVPEARTNLNACGSGAMAATVAAARELGCTGGKTIEYITSHEVARERRFRMAVGYVGMIFPMPE